MVHGQAPEAASTPCTLESESSQSTVHRLFVVVVEVEVEVCPAVDVVGALV